MKLIDRKKCALTGENDLERLFVFKEYPLFMGCTSQPLNKDVKVDMEWVISKSSGAIQLGKLIPLDILYSENHNNIIGNIWKNHHHEFAKFIALHEPKGGILEIGGAHGYLSKIYQKKQNIDWTIIEPNPVPIEGCKATFIKGIFSKELIGNINYETIIHSHVMEHIYEPNDFLNLITNCLDNNQKMIFSIPNMKKMLENNYTNCINFEHTIYLNENLLETLLAKYNFAIIDKKYFLDDHSIFYCVKKDIYLKNTNKYVDEYIVNLKMFNNYVNYYENLIEEINIKIKDIKSDIYLFGAHVFSQHLIVNGLNIDNIKNILDNDIKKQGKRLYGTNINVSSPKILANKKNPYVIIKAGVYTDEIKLDIINNINSETIFIE